MVVFQELVLESCKFQFEVVFDLFEEVASEAAIEETRDVFEVIADVAIHFDFGVYLLSCECVQLLTELVVIELIWLQIVE